jgi:ubiquinone/menaquinone biosynthesis C-methylase UbiE
MENVRNFWDKRASAKAVTPDQVTHKDIWQRWLEIQHISRYLEKNDRVADIGCGNGYSTRIFAGLVREIIGMDYSETMVARAREETRLENPSGKAPTFLQCNVLDLSPEISGYFDKAVSERCLINLADFEEQKRAISNIASVLKPGGRFIFVEGSEDGRGRLNALRKRVGLTEMPRVWHNVDFKEAETLSYMEQWFVLEERKSFGIYDFLSRVVHPLLVAPKEPGYEDPINEIAARLSVETEGLGSISRVLFLVLRKKAQ